MTIGALRAHLDAKKALDGALYVATARRLLAAAASSVDVDEIVACLKSHAPPSGHGLNRDMESARARLIEAAR